jgi:hypothetical protein
MLPDDVRYIIFEGSHPFKEKMEIRSRDGGRWEHTTVETGRCHRSGPRRPPGNQCPVLAILRGRRAAGVQAIGAFVTASMNECLLVPYSEQRTTGNRRALMACSRLFGRGKHGLGRQVQMAHFPTQ